MVNKKDFFAHMSEVYKEEFNDNDSYKILKSIMKTTDSSKIQELKKLIYMDSEQRLLYRNMLASNGRELTPRQVDQYITLVEYALSNMNLD